MSSQTPCGKLQPLRLETIARLETQQKVYRNKKVIDTTDQKQHARCSSTLNPGSRKVIQGEDAFAKFKAKPLPKFYYDGTDGGGYQSE